MTSKWSIVFFFIAIVAATLHTSTAQTTHVVGDVLGWTFPPAGAVAYTAWASQQSFTVGDTLVFNFSTGRHNVGQVSRTSYDACNVTSPILTASNGPANITLNSTGEHFYICTFPTHCDAGMKLAINVSAPPVNTTTPPPQPTSSPASVPSPAPVPAPVPSRASVPSPAPVPSPSRTPESYVVGDAIGWIFPSSGLAAYPAWASNKTFFVGDMLVFNFANGRHNVAELTSKTDFESCNSSGASNPITTSPARITLNTPGEHFYVCTFPTHCDAGMKLAVNVSSSATNSPPSNPTTSPPTSGGIAPAGGFVPPPPSPSSASKFVVASAMPITLLSIAFALFY